MSVLIEVKGLRKTFKLGLFKKNVEAVKDISFTVNSGGIFGCLGPNGAGKTTTIKTLTGLIYPSAGEVKLFGKSAGDHESRRRLGYLPENPYIYPYLSPREFVSLAAKLAGVRSSQLRSRVNEVLEHVGIAYAADRPSRKLSKGMLQRTGLAAALVGDPELLILDEPMSGLDPMGRKEVRDLIIHEKARGRTIFFCTHILGDAEMICDEVAILKKGELVVRGTLQQLLTDSTKRTELHLEGLDEALETDWRSQGWLMQREGAKLRLVLEGDEAIRHAIGQLSSSKLRLLQLHPLQQSLEELFVREAGEP